MGAERQLLYACARQDFRGMHESKVRDLSEGQRIDWDVVWRLALSEGIAPLVYTNLKRCTPATLGLPPQIERRFNRYLWQNMVRRENTARKLAEALAFCQDKAMDAMLVKGAALNTMVYDQPWYTFSEDVDLVIGRAPAISDEPDPAAIISYLEQLNRGGGSLQEHIEYEFFEHHDVTMNGILPVDFGEIWREAVPVLFRGQAAFVMAPEDMLVSACIGSCRKRFFRLKSLCDIRELIERQDLDWQAVTRKARAYQCSNIVYAALRVTDLTLGCTLPPGTLGGLAVNPIRARALSALATLLSRCAHRSYPSLNPEGEGLATKWSAALLLTYATYTWGQIWGKAKRIWDVMGSS